MDLYWEGGTPYGCHGGGDEEPAHSVPGGVHCTNGIGAAWDDREQGYGVSRGRGGELFPCAQRCMDEWCEADAGALSGRQGVLEQGEHVFRTVESWGCATEYAEEVAPFAYTCAPLVA